MFYSFFTLSAVFFWCERGLNIALEEWQIGHWTAAKPNGFLAWSPSRTTHTHSAKKQTDCRAVIFPDRTCLEPYRSPFPLCPAQRRIRETVRNGYSWLVKERESTSRQNAPLGSGPRGVSHSHLGLDREFVFSQKFLNVWVQTQELARLNA